MWNTSGATALHHAQAGAPLQFSCRPAFHTPPHPGPRYLGDQPLGPEMESVLCHIQEAVHEAEEEVEGRQAGAEVAARVHRVHPRGGGGGEAQAPGEGWAAQHREGRLAHGGGLKPDGWAPMAEGGRLPAALLLQGQSRQLRSQSQLACSQALAYT